MGTPRGGTRRGIPPESSTERLLCEGLTRLGRELCSHHGGMQEALSWGCRGASSSGCDEAVSEICVPWRLSNALQTEEKGLPVGQEGVQAPGCGRGCSGSLRGACGWAVLPSCMPASQGHGLQNKMRAFLYTCLFTFSTALRWRKYFHLPHFTDV